MLVASVFLFVRLGCAAGRRSNHHHRYFFSSAWPQRSKGSQSGNWTMIPITPVPQLMLSPLIHPQTRYFCDLTALDAGATPIIKVTRKIYLPDMAGLYCFSFSPGFVFSTPTRCSRNITAINPFTDELLPLPPTSALPSITTPKIGSFKPNPWESQPVVDFNEFSLFYNMIALSNSRDMAILIRKRYDDPDEAYFSCLSSSTSAWTPLSLGGLEDIHDCMFHQDRVIVIDHNGYLASFKQVNDPKVMITNIDLKVMREVLHFSHRKYLVESPDAEDLFLVCRDADEGPRSLKTSCFKVYVFDKYTWKLVNNLGGLAFFIGPGRSASLCAANHPNLEPDSIYFTDDLPSEYFFSSYGMGLCDTGVFNMQTKSVKFFRPPPTGAEMDHFWPPPTWIVPCAC